MKAGMAERSGPSKAPHPVVLPSPITASRQTLRRRAPRFSTANSANRARDTDCRDSVGSTALEPSHPLPCEAEVC